MSPRTLDSILLVLLLAGCTPTTLSTGPSAGHLQADNVARPQGAIPQPVQQSVSLPRPRTIAKTETYSVVVNNVEVHNLLFALARDAKLNVDIHPGITGLVTLNAIDQTLPQLLTRIAKQVDMQMCIRDRLRVLENGEYQRVGETQKRVSQARIIAATNRDLRKDCLLYTSRCV